MMPFADAPTLTVPINEHDHLIGSPLASVTLVEYGDYECPHCGAAHPIVQEVLRELGGALCFAFRHFPLKRVHPHAERAAEAAEAAGAQGRFWHMHDMLFEHQQALEDENLLTYAQVLELNMRRFANDLATGVHAPKIRADFLSGVRSGVNGTPTFFIDGRRHDGGYDLQTLLSAIAAVAAARQR